MAWAETSADPAKEADKNDILVTGSLLPAASIGTASPVVVITADDIRKKGFTEVFDALRSSSLMTGAMRDSVPGSGNMQGVKMISLFGLGPNYTKVMINGRPMANYPLNNNTGDGGNFANLSTIPAAMVERIEILPGTQSATYGADAVAGVVNIILKKHVDATTVSARYGAYDEGGGESMRVQLVGGASLTPATSLVYAFEFNDRKAILGTDRKKTAYSPYEDDAFARVSSSQYYDPGEAGCAQMSDLFGGSMTYRVDGAKTYCGTDYTRSSVATYDSARRSFSGYAALHHDFSATSELYAELTGTFSRTISNWGPVYVWQNFTDSASGTTYLVSREFAPEEMGSWKTSANHNYGTEYNATMGVKGSLGAGWQYDVYVNRSFSRILQRTFLPISSEMTAYLTERYSDISQVFVPLTPSEYAGFSGTRRRASSDAIQQLSAKAFNTGLFALPGGAAGLAIQAEAGNELWKDIPDAGYQAGIYFDGSQLASRGSRNHGSLAGELALPAFDWISGTLAARYDGYRYSGHSADRVTWKAGLEIKPLDGITLRGGIGTAFRAPDMSYLFLGQSVGNSNTYDLYLCDQMGVSRTSSSCRYVMRNESVGNLDLKPVTATSKSLGVLLTPVRSLSFSADYIDIDIKNEVKALTLANILFDEAACQQGGSAVYLASCEQATSLVTRDASTGLVTSVTRGYFNVSKKQVRSLMIAAKYRAPETPIGLFSFDLNYSRVLAFKSQADSVSPVIDQLANPTGYGMFKDTLNASVTLDKGPLSTTVTMIRYGKSPNYALLTGGWGSTAYGTPGYDDPWTLFNASIKFDIGHGFGINGVVNNIANRMPPSQNWDGFPYYNAALYNVYGRSFTIEATKTF